MIDLSIINYILQIPFKILKFLGPLGIVLCIDYFICFKKFHKVKLKERILWPYYLPKFYYYKLKNQIKPDSKKNEDPKCEGPYTSWRKEQRKWIYLKEICLERRIGFVFYLGIIGVYMVLIKLWFVKDVSWIIQN